MANDDRPVKRRNGKALPSTLLALLVAATAGTYVWAHLASPGHAPGSAMPPGPERTVTLVKAEAAVKAKPKTVVKTKAAPKAAKTKPQQAFRALGTPTYPRARLPVRGSLTTAPDPALVRDTPSGKLPKVGSDGRKPWKVYARPFNRDDKRPRVAVVISGLGLDRKATEAAIGALPGPVTLSFTPYAPGLDRWIKQARVAGHEVLLDIPMEPAEYPQVDPGPQVLLTSLSETENRTRLHWALGRAAGYVGAVGHMGSRFTGSRRHMLPVLTELASRGLMFLDTREAPRSVAPELANRIRMPWASSTVALDGSTSSATLDAQLGRLERFAKEEGRSVGLAAATPLAIRRIASWASKLGARGIALAPVSALTRTGPTG